MDLVRDSDTVIQQYLESNCFAGPDDADTTKKYLEISPGAFFIEVDVFAG